MHLKDAGDVTLLDTITPATAKSRVQSLDIFRGLNIALMIFVNELADIKGLPWWTYHAKGNWNVMTYVDMVFPGFLLIVGMSLPLALRARIRRGDKTLQLVWYIVARSAALIVLGLILANGPEGKASLMHGLNPFVWSLLALLAAFLVWFAYPETEDARQLRTYQVLRFCGMLFLVVLALVYRKVDPVSKMNAGLNFAYPESLGIIGYTYFVSGLCYLLTRRWLWAPLVWFVAFVGLNIASADRLVNPVHPWWWFPVQNGAFPALVFSGVMLSTLFFLEPRCNTFARKALPAVVFGVVTAMAAWLLSPLGISKIRATPTWVLYTTAACYLIYVALYFVCDVKEKTAWAAPVRSSGSNTLMTYLLPDFWYFGIAAIDFVWLGNHINSGVVGVLRTVLFTVIMLGLSTWLTKRHVRLQI
jgi:heparan-alpha-glucosaminide N-acetyltransferase